MARRLATDAKIVLERAGYNVSRHKGMVAEYLAYDDQMNNLVITGGTVDNAEVVKLLDAKGFTETGHKKKGAWSALIHFQHPRCLPCRLCDATASANGRSCVSMCDRLAPDGLSLCQPSHSLAPIVPPQAVKSPAQISSGHAFNPIIGLHPFSQNLNRSRQRGPTLAFHALPVRDEVRGREQPHDAQREPYARPYSHTDHSVTSGLA
jgi:predicted RNA binding protein YcfA (HicA-like mRNA interferase family)